jgi:hypothetical protein
VGGDWVGEAFRKHTINVAPSAKPKADIYVEILPMLTHLIHRSERLGTCYE